MCPTPPEPACIKTLAPGVRLQLSSACEILEFLHHELFFIYQKALDSITSWMVLSFIYALEVWYHLARQACVQLVCLKVHAHSFATHHNLGIWLYSSHWDDWVVRLGLFASDNHQSDCRLSPYASVQQDIKLSRSEVETHFPDWNDPHTKTPC